MSFNDINGFAEAIKEIHSLPNIESLVDDDNGLKVLSSNSNKFLQNVEDDGTIDVLEAIEISATYYFFDEYNRLDQSNIAKVKKHDIKVITLDEKFLPFTHALQTDKFHILFGD